MPLLSGLDPAQLEVERVGACSAVVGLCGCSTVAAIEGAVATIGVWVGWASFVLFGMHPVEDEDARMAAISLRRLVVFSIKAPVKFG